MMYGSNHRIHHTSLYMVLLSFLLLLAGRAAMGQEATPAPAAGKANENKRSVKVSGSMQFWLRYTELNPGSLVQNEARSNLWDLSIRRYRLKFSGKATDKLRYTLELGNNDLNYYATTSTLPHLLDAYVDYQLSEHLALGAGKQAWAGPSRYAAPSSTQALGYDLDFVAAPFVNVYDDILRRMGIYARGQAGGFDYRLSLAKPSYSANTGKVAIGETAGFSDQQPDYQLSGYLKYQLQEHEEQHSPYAPGTYLGKKRVLNLGFGALYQPRTSWSLSGTDTLYHAARSLAADLFWEKPLMNSRSLTAYLAFIRHNLGPGFMRYMGANNPATGGGAEGWVNGRGNTAPVIGTGHSGYLQLGYLRPLNLENTRQLQLFAALQWGRFEALHDPVLIYSAGLTYLLHGQSAKLTLGLQSRPVFKASEHFVTEALRKEMLVLQYQILFGS